MKRPYVICHMLISKNGKVTGDFLKREDVLPSCEEYYDINREEKADGYACGSTTMKESFAGEFYPDLTDYREDESKLFVAKKYDLYCLSYDRRGRVGWQTPVIDDPDPGYGGAGIVEIVTKRADKRYLSYLKDIGASFMVVEEEEEIKKSLEILYSEFGVRKVLLEGGSEINGAFLRENCVDELSLVRVPVEEEGGKELFFGEKYDCFELFESKILPSGSVWERYRVRK